MGKSVEAKARPGRTTGVAFRQVWKPRPLCVVDPASPIEAVSRIVPRITENQRSCGLTSCLLIDPSTSQAFVLAEDKPVAVEMLRQGPRSPYWPWFVGVYRFTKADASAAASVLDDIREHLGIAPPPPAAPSLTLQLDLFTAMDAAA
ncbi:hypothetical protein BCL79_0632 [Stenotrophomonas rhizophila]|uniref:Uncharacterized protein n=1 Tax=Stenotrophomonas rhizophila TaxID=216778 RepID=A0A498CEB3_9GAMM|nr:hypothetical protein [Stenotrophomonas rhizophila]RLK56249.1 hypothetical protein BCL79_0632 [Stenotrophomonas rhizophila]